LNIVANWLKTLPLLPESYDSSGTSGSHEAGTTTGIKIKAATCFTAAAMPGLPVSDPRTASGTVMMRMLSEGFLWNEIRSRRGAYGAGASLGGGTVSFYSYRDPSPVETVALFREAVTDGFSKLDLTPRSIEDSIIASVKGIDPPVRPAMANGMAIMRHLRGMDRDFAGKHRGRLLAVNRDSIAEYAEWMGSSPELLRVCIMGKCFDPSEVTRSIIL
jgi:Zn-dependent M16 (insulinase) family peptidase